MEKIIVVDDHDQEIGVMEKLKVHKTGTLHRAFSIFVFDVDGQLVVQKRAANKYHSSGLWANSVCSHPREKESLAEAVPRRLMDELGIECSNIIEVGTLAYRAEFENGLIEHEFDHVFAATYYGETPEVPFDELEIEEVAWKTLEKISEEASRHPEDFAIWFRLILSDSDIFDNLQAYVDQIEI